MSPANILLSQRGEQLHATVIDFGLARCLDTASGAKLTDTGDVLGTPRYMSPEQAAGECAGPASDVYALGCIAYEMLTGVPAASGDTIADVLAHQREHEPAPFARVAPGSDIPPEFEAVVLRALRKSADRRFADMTALRDALVAVGAPKPALAPTRWRRTALAFALGATALAAALAQLV
jgi:serine/threonine-protein kinase